MSDLCDFVQGELVFYARSRLLNRLARKAGIDKTTLYHLRDGTGSASVDSLEKILDAMDYDIILKKRSDRPWAV